jgi:hypothetical protein
MRSFDRSIIGLDEAGTLHPLCGMHWYFFEIDDDDTNTNDKDDNTYDERYFWEGKLQYTKYFDSK